MEMETRWMYLTEKMDLRSWKRRVKTEQEIEEEHNGKR